MTGALMESAFEVLFRTHAVRFAKLAHLLGADEPEDVVQEAFCKFYTAHREQELSNELGYLHRIVVNEVRTRQRRRAVAERNRLYPAPVGPASEQVERNESVQGLMLALDGLPARQREALVLRYWLDLPLAEIAVTMQTRLGTVKSLISRGMNRLAQELEEHR